MLEEYRLETRVKNNLILEKIESAGYPSLANFCEVNKLSAPSLYNLINFKISALTTRGKLSITVYKICDALNCLPEELFTQNQLDLILEKNKYTTKVNEAEMKFYLENSIEPLELDEQVQQDHQKTVLNRALQLLTEREKKIIIERFGLDGKGERTLQEVAATTVSLMGPSIDKGVTRERIRQSESKALRRLRHFMIISELDREL